LTPGELLMPRLLRLLPLSLVLVLMVAPDAHAQQIDRIEIVEWGIFQHDRLAEIAADTPRGTRNIVTNVRLQHATTTVPALVGMKFGFRFKVAGSPPGMPVSVRFVTRFPKQGITNPANGRASSTSEIYLDTAVGDITYGGYSFADDWEVETGPWTLELWHGGRKLAEKTFVVTRPVSSAEQGRTEVSGPGLRFQGAGIEWPRA
jgi:Domain of unknown function (DUF3859)